MTSLCEMSRVMMIRIISPFLRLCLAIRMNALGFVFFLVNSSDRPSFSGYIRRAEENLD